jgi:hypothetical protein
MRRASFQLDPKGTTQYIWLGKVAEVPDYEVKVAKGEKRPQARDENGTPLWVIDCDVEDGSPRTNVVGIRVAAEHQPVFEKYKPVQFTSLDVSVYITGSEQNPQLGFKYEGVLKQAPAAAATKAA